MTIPLVDLKAQFQGIKTEVMAELEKVLDQMQLFLGPRSRAFEQDFAAYSGCEYGVGVSSGTDALALALRACGIGPGDEVITVSHTFIATVEAIAMVGAVPVFVDIDPITYTLDWQWLPQVVTERTKAIIPVHLYGHPAEMGPILDFARAHKLMVIEDASQAHGATYHGKPAGGLGDIGCFSLYYSKNLGAYGEAGICTTDNLELAEKMQMLRDHGSKVRYQHELMGVNARLDEMQASILNVKLPHLDDWNKARASHAAFYTSRLRDQVMAVPQVRPESSHVYYTYVIQLKERDRVRHFLEQEGIHTGIHFPIPAHLQPACERYGYHRGMLPVTEQVVEHILSLPMYPELQQDQLETVVRTIHQSQIEEATRA